MLSFGVSWEVSALWKRTQSCVSHAVFRAETSNSFPQGSLPVGEIGKLLQEATANASLSQTLKDQFGGLKKFLEKVCTVQQQYSSTVQ